MRLTPLGKFIGLLVFAGALAGAYTAYRNGALGGHPPAQTTGFDSGTQAPQSAQAPSAAPSVAPAAAPAPTQVAYTPEADTRKFIMQNHVVRISVENPSEPIYGETNGQPHGFNYEFAKLLFSQKEFASNGPITIDTRHEVTTYKDVPKQLLLTDNGAPVVDIAMDGLTFNDNTPAGVVYTNAYLEDFGYALIVQKGSPIRTPGDLAGKAIGILQGDPDVKAFVQRQFPQAQIVSVSDDSGDQFIANAVDNHQVDAFIYDYPFAVESIKGSDLTFAQTKLDGSSLSYKIGVRAADENLLFALNSAIGRVKSSPEYLDLLRRYFRSNQTVITAAGTGEHTYSVRRGDTLNTIASAQLGSGARYRDIQRRNNLANPNLILAGETLVIPAR